METFVVFIIKSKDENFDLSYLINESSRKERQEKYLEFPTLEKNLDLIMTSLTNIQKIEKNYSTKRWAIL